MGMVKAFAYGAGDAVAVELDRLGIDWLAVAFTEEGVSLRKRGVTCPILVLHADHRRYADLIQWHLEPEIHRLEDLDHWADALRRSGPSVRCPPRRRSPGKRDARRPDPELGAKRAVAALDFVVVSTATSIIADDGQRPHPGPDGRYGPLVRPSSKAE